MKNEEYNFNKLAENDVSIILKIAEEIILEYYDTFLDKNIVNEYISSKQSEKEILENIENCITMKIGNKIIGFSIIIENKIHLIMVGKKNQNKNHGTNLLKFTENKLF